MKMADVIPLLLTVMIASCSWAEEQDPYQAERLRMVKDQIQRRGINDPKVLEAMKKVKRHLFVPEQSCRYAYDDHPLSIGYRQTISQPFIVAYMTESAGLSEKDKVLEIGTGSGYQAAVLGQIVKEVYAIEIVEELVRTASERLKKLGYKNIFVRRGDGYQGWPKKAPFDVVIVTAAPPETPQELLGQLKVGGRMIIPVGSFSQELLRITRTEDGFKTEKLLPVRFVPMVRED